MWCLEAVCDEKPLGPYGVQRTAEEVPLGEIAFEVGEQLALIETLDAHGDCRQTEVPHQADDAGEQVGWVAVAAANIVEKGLCDLDEVDWQVREVQQRGVPGAELVQGDADTELLQRL